MPAQKTASAPIICDGCLLEANADHLRDRIARLEFASRFRPIHISTLVLAPTPPERLEDYFYFPHALPRDLASRALFEDLTAACEAGSPGQDKEAVLREFQRKGYFFAEAIECPMAPEQGSEADAPLARLLPTLLRRVRYSYRPKFVLVLGEQLRSVSTALASATETKLLLGRPRPVALAAAENKVERERFRSHVRELLRSPAA